MKHFRNILILICCVGVSIGAQQVTVSPEINIRSDNSYYLLGSVGESILLFRDQGNNKVLNVFNEDMVLSSERTVNLINKRSFVYEVVNQDSVFSVFYGFKDAKEVVLYMDVFSPTAERRDSIEIYREESSIKGLQYKAVLSENQQVIALYNTISKDELKVLVYDIADRQVIISGIYQIPELNLITEINQMEVSDSGEFLLMYDKNNFKGSKENHFARIIKFLPRSIETEEINIPIKGLLTADLMMKVDNRNRKVALTGLYDEKSLDRSTGYLWVSGSLDQWGDEDVYFFPFEEIIFFEVYGDNKSKKLRDFKISSILLKADGTPILVFELSKDVIRQPGFGTNAYSTQQFRSSNSSSSAGWSDHYREDLVLISLNKNLALEWHHVFYKKQFSQNDNGLFSSYFPFVTPSRVRFIYNDEIKTNSTVSEYIFDGAGNYKRNSLLSTEYQNLRLMFRYALQTSNNVLLVPSQRNTTLNLVKVDFIQ